MDPREGAGPGTCTHVSLPCTVWVPGLSAQACFRVVAGQPGGVTPRAQRASCVSWKHPRGGSNPPRRRGPCTPEDRQRSQPAADRRAKTAVAPGGVAQPQAADRPAAGRSGVCGRTWGGGGRPDAGGAPRAVTPGDGKEVGVQGPAVSPRLLRHPPPCDRPLGGDCVTRKRPPARDQCPSGARGLPLPATPAPRWEEASPEPTSLRPDPGPPAARTGAGLWSFPTARADAHRCSVLGPALSAGPPGAAGPSLGRNRRPRLLGVCGSPWEAPLSQQGVSPHNPTHPRVPGPLHREPFSGSSFLRRRNTAHLTHGATSRLSVLTGRALSLGLPTDESVSSANTLPSFSFSDSVYFLLRTEAGRQGG